MNTYFRWLMVWLALLVSACSSAPKKTAAPPVARSEMAPVLDYALSLQGAPYAYGKASPEEGFDCSGFIWHVYRRNGFRLPRSTEQMAYALPEIEPAQRRAGDLLFFQTGDKPFSHVGLYLGRQAFIHAPSSKTGRVMVSSLEQAYWQERLVGVRRPMR